LGEAITAAVYLLNRSTSKSIGGKSAYELWNASPPAMHHLHMFRCVAHDKVTTPHFITGERAIRPQDPSWWEMEPGLIGESVSVPKHRTPWGPMRGA